MKKVLLLIYAMVSGLYLTSCITASALTNDTAKYATVQRSEQLPIDSASLQQIGDLGFQVAVMANNGNELIKGVPNGFLHSVGALLLGFIIRAIEKRRLRKKGKLKDKEFKE